MAKLLKKDPWKLYSEGFKLESDRIVLKTAMSRRIITNIADGHRRLEAIDNRLMFINKSLKLKHQFDRL